MLKLKLQYFGHLMRIVDSLEKTLMLGRIGSRRRRGRQDNMAGWHHRLDGHEFEWTPGVGDGQGSLACCDSWGRKESDTTERLNWTELNWLQDRRIHSGINVQFLKGMRTEHHPSCRVCGGRGIAAIELLLPCNGNDLPSYVLGPLYKVSFDLRPLAFLALCEPHSLFPVLSFSA